MMTFCIERDLILNLPPLLVGLIKPIGLNSILAHNSVISKPNELKFCPLTFEIEMDLIFSLPPLLVGLINFEGFKSINSPYLSRFSTK